MFFLFNSVFCLGQISYCIEPQTKPILYLKVKIDGFPIPKGRLVKGPRINQYVGTVPSTFQLLYVFFSAKSMVLLEIPGHQHSFTHLLGV